MRKKYKKKLRYRLFSKSFFECQFTGMDHTSKGIKEMEKRKKGKYKKGKAPLLLPVVCPPLKSNAISEYQWSCPPLFYSHADQLILDGLSVCCHWTDCAWGTSGFEDGLERCFDYLCWFINANEIVCKSHMNIITSPVLTEKQSTIMKYSNNHKKVLINFQPADNGSYQS